jgi:hypothetical protein
MDLLLCLARVDIAPPKPNHNGRVLLKPQQKLGSQKHSKQEIKSSYQSEALPLLLFFFHALL